MAKTRRVRFEFNEHSLVSLERLRVQGAFVMSDSSDCSDAVRRFDGESYCVIFCLKNSDVVQMTSNVGGKDVAQMIVDAMRKRGDHVFKAVPAGVLIAALELIVKKDVVV